uniref:Uncharacterized protein n=1 Tax=Ciona intestinalis TaxID=7719 RepID=H2XWY2_CIOIN
MEQCHLEIHCRKETAHDYCVMCEPLIPCTYGKTPTPESLIHFVVLFFVVHFHFSL